MRSPNRAANNFFATLVHFKRSSCSIIYSNPTGAEIVKNQISNTPKVIGVHFSVAVLEKPHFEQNVSPYYTDKPRINALNNM